MINSTKFSLLFLFTLSFLFLVSQCYDVPEVLVDLQRCKIRCFEKEFISPNEEHLCIVECHETYAQDRENNGQITPQIEDPKKFYEQCKKSCSMYEGSGRKEQKQYCLNQCRDLYEEHRKSQEEAEKHGGDQEIENHHDPRYVSPEKKFWQCQQDCQSKKEVGEMKSCHQQCKEEYGRESRREGEHGGEDNLLGKKKEKEEEQKEDKNPYFFEDHRFESRLRTEEGNFRVLQRFSEKSELLTGIDNYRLAKLEANPNTFMIPHHCDAEAIFVVTNGQGTITFVHQQHRESFKLGQGDAIKVPAGSTVYLINHDNNEKLRILMFVHPINTPGHFEEFFGAGGQDPQSFYSVFSNELLEAALNTPEDRFKRLFGKHKKGFIVKASQEQIRALSQDSEVGPTGSSQQEAQGGQFMRGPFNPLQEPPRFSNEYGQFFVATPDTHEQLRDLDSSVAFMNINQGAMIVPYYNTKSTIVVTVRGGEGYFEMACPHVSSQGQESSKGKKKEKEDEKEKEKERRTRTTSVGYQKISASFSVGDVFIIPAGHPISIVSSGNQNLQLVGFGINAKNNGKHFLAGNNNIWNQVKEEAKELSFETQAREVDEVFGNQQNAYFVPGPKKSQKKEEEGSGQNVASILDFMGFI